MCVFYKRKVQDNKKACESNQEMEKTYFSILAPNSLVCFGTENQNLSAVAAPNAALHSVLLERSHWKGIGGKHRQKCSTQIVAPGVSVLAGAKFAVAGRQM